MEGINRKKMAIYFDMDGTIADLYGVEGWLRELRSGNPAPYGAAKPLLNLQILARRLNFLTKLGWKIGIVSWTAKNSTREYSQKVEAEKRKWLRKHLSSVEFTEIVIAEYGTPKEEIVNYPEGILFDDEENNRNNWKGKAFDEKNILEILKSL